MAAFQDRRDKHDLTDIEYLVWTFPDEIRTFANQLDPDKVELVLEKRPRFKSAFGF